MIFVDILTIGSWLGLAVFILAMAISLFARLHGQGWLMGTSIINGIVAALASLFAIYLSWGLVGLLVALLFGPVGLLAGTIVAFVELPIYALSLIIFPATLTGLSVWRLSSVERST